MKRIIPETLATAGLGGIGYGLWLVHPALAFIVIGSFVAFLGVRLKLSGGKR